MKNYIVPAKLLVGVVMKTEEENVNQDTSRLIKEVENNKEIKKMIFDLSKKMTEVVNNEAMFVVLPGFMPPEEENHAQKSISEFIEKMVK